MNKTLKRILTGVGILVAVFVLIMGGFFLKMKSEIKNMHVTETQEIIPGVFAIKDSFVNMFLINDSTGYVAVDAGSDIKTIRNEMNKLNIDSSKVVALLLTHADGDHTAALSLFKNAKVYMSRDEEQMINGTTAKMMFYHNSIPTKNYTLLEDNKTLTIGSLRVKCIATPGHTPGSMSYLINDSLLFVGDAFGLENGKISKPNSFFSKDMKLAIQSLAKIANLPKASYIFTAHTGFSDNYSNAMTDWDKIKE
jgi:glyoxylase-like metal-dependent hydrolase (beta-lactamase superfamily II)